jgi:ribosomal protein S18 acetylase RimI-like enzyme
MNGPSSFTFRHPANEDLAKAAAVFGAEEQAVRGGITYGVDELRDWWRLYDLDASWLVENDEQEPIAFAGFLARGAEFNTWIGVDPRYNGRGLSTELIRRSERRARELGGDRIKAGALAENVAARRLLEALGFHEARRFYRMQVDLDGAPSEPEKLEGIRIETFEPEHARAFHAALNEALSDDWGFVGMPFEEWRRHRLDSPDTDTSLWFLAWDGGEVAGTIRCDNKRFGGGFVGALGVRRPWRGRGIGTALLRRAFAEYYGRGIKRVSLGVDSENRSGATRLYERAGMRVVSEDVLFEKTLT